MTYAPNRTLKVFVGASAVLVSSAAQAQVSTELPPVVVEGATLEAKPKRNSASGPPASTPKPKQTSGPSAPTPQPAPAVEAAEVDDASGASESTGTGGVEARKLATPVSVVTGAELRARQIRDAAEALRSLPGVAVSSTGSSGNVTQVRMRGAEGNHTLVMIDGIEANDTSSGEFDFSNLSADEIERIEVIRGVQSGLYGSRAIGGVVNIITLGGKGPLRVRASGEGGSFNTRSFSGSISKGTDRYYYAISGSTKETDGFNIAPRGSEDDGYERRTINVRAGAKLLDNLGVDFNVRRSQTVAGYDNFGTIPPFTPFVVQTAVDAPNESDADVLLGGGKLTWDLFNGALTQVVGANFNRTDRASYNKTDPSSLSETENARDRYYYLSTLRLGDRQLRHIVSGLVESEQEEFTPGAFSDRLTREREREAYAVEYRGEYFDRLFPIASVRHEDNDTFQDFTTWKTGLSVDIHELGVRPHASVGTAVALPGMFEQFGSVLGTFVGNPNLAPEESFSWDAGIEFTVLKGRASVDVTYFEANLENEIVGFGNSVRNLPGESERQGLEIAGRYRLTDQLTVGGAYTHLRASDSTGLAEVRRPEHAGKLDINYLFDGGRGAINVAAIYNGDTKDTQFFDTLTSPFFGSQFTTLDDYVLLNIAASYKVAPEVEIFGRVENALNEDYQQVFGYETAGTTAYVGLRFDFNAEPALAAMK